VALMASCKAPPRRSAQSPTPRAVAEQPSHTPQPERRSCRAARPLASPVASPSARPESALALASSTGVLAAQAQPRARSRPSPLRSNPDSRACKALEPYSRKWLSAALENRVRAISCQAPPTACKLLTSYPCQEYVRREWFALGVRFALPFAGRTVVAKRARPRRDTRPGSATPGRIAHQKTRFGITPASTWLL
jgi:hypothetical protein